MIFKVLKKLVFIIVPVVFLGLVGFLAFEYAFERMQPVIVEAGSPIPEAGEFFTRYREGAVYAEAPDPEMTLVPGVYTLEIHSWRQVYKGRLQVEDTIAPEVTPVPVTLMLGQEAEPEDFITDVKDITEVKLSFAAPVDFSKAGLQLVTIVAEDLGGNHTVVDAGLQIISDTTPPVIKGVKNQSLYEGETISYKKGVTCSDDYTPEADLQLEIDNSQVDLDKAGDYIVTYTVTDAAGNTASKTAVITVINRAEEDAEIARKKLQDQLDPLVEKALNACHKEGQTDREYLKRMFNWTRNHMSYTGTSDKTAELQEALRGFTKGRGDCFTYFAVLKQLMEGAGFETCDVRRINGKTDHFWSLVKLDGEWYHIDSCPRSASHHKEWICFLRTDAELEMFTTKMVKGYYTFDKSLVPRTP